MYKIVVGAKYADNNNAHISIMFNITGINAANINRENAFNTADKNAAAQIKMTYQNIMREITVVVSNLPGSDAKPGANIVINTGINISNMIEKYTGYKNLSAKEGR